MFAKSIGVHMTSPRIALLCATLLVVVANAADEFNWVSAQIYTQSDTCSGAAQTFINSLDRCSAEGKLVRTGDNITMLSYSGDNSSTCTGAPTETRTFVVGSCVQGTKQECFPDAKCSHLFSTPTAPSKQPPCGGIDYPLTAFYTDSKCSGTPFQIQTIPCTKSPRTSGSSIISCNSGSKPQRCRYESTDCSGGNATCTDLPGSEGADCTMGQGKAALVVCPTSANPNPLNCASYIPGTTTTTTNGDAKKKDNKKGVPAGYIVLAVVIVLLVLIIVAVIIYIVVRKKQMRASGKNDLTEQKKSNYSTMEN